MRSTYLETNNMHNCHTFEPTIVRLGHTHLVFGIRTLDEHLVWGF